MIKLWIIKLLLGWINRLDNVDRDNPLIIIFIGDGIIEIQHANDINKQVIKLYE